MGTGCGLIIEVGYIGFHVLNLSETIDLATYYRREPDMTDSRDLDLIVYGATGFTGQLVCEYLNRTYGVGGDYKWGMAGRSKSKLEQVRDELALDASIPLIVADTSDMNALTTMASSTKVLLSAVGPYTSYGSDVVKVCAEAGTDYLDLCGEPLWMKEMIEKYDATAKKSGARIVFSCGFDSIPFEMGVFYLQNAAQEKLGAVLPRVKGRVRSMQGTASGGTVASFAATMKSVEATPELFTDLINPFALTPGFTGPEQPNGDKKIYEDDLESWSGPFVMATINTKNVHRSNMLLGHSYGKDFVYDEMVLLGVEEPNDDVKQDEDMSFDMSLKPGEGPSKEQREAGFYDVSFIGTSANGETLKATVTGDQDPGYGSTSKIIAEAAICLLENSGGKGGIQTPAPAMGMALIERLVSNAGLSFSI
jgi:short subunit dehydrogenase-like uncharacterized protein